MTHPCLAAWLDVLACPACLSALERLSDVSLICSRCRAPYPVDRGMISLVPGARRDTLHQRSRGYREARIAEGWRPLSRDERLALPYGAPAGYPALYWPARRGTFEAFEELLQGWHPDQTHAVAADLGAGNGWLAYRMAKRGLRSLALDASIDLDFGLGASEPYRSTYPDRFLPVLGDLDALPLRAAALDLIVFNASIHYVRDVNATLYRAARALRPGGHLAILDTPTVEHGARAPNGPGSHVVRREIDQALAGVGLVVDHLEVRRGIRWHLYQARVALRGGRRFSFPILTAAKPSGSGLNGSG